MPEISKKILVVDDDPDTVSYLSLLLSENNYNILTASNGKECFEQAKSELPDLICLDITMPDESGVRAYRNLCENELTKKIPVVIVTGIAHDFKHFIETRKQIPPPAAYFEKPFDKIEFIKKIKELI